MTQDIDKMHTALSSKSQLTKKVNLLTGDLELLATKIMAGESKGNVRPAELFKLEGIPKLRKKGSSKSK